jgi:hypothetical protein
MNRDFGSDEDTATLGEPYWAPIREQEEPEAGASGDLPFPLFGSKEDMLKHLKAVYLAQGVILTTKRSYPRNIYLQCNRGKRRQRSVFNFSLSSRVPTTGVKPETQDT